MEKTMSSLKFDPRLFFLFAIAIALSPTLMAATDGAPELLPISKSNIYSEAFVQCIALILMSELRRAMRESKLKVGDTVRELLLEMDPLTKINYEGKYGVILTKVTRPQREILHLLKIELPKSA